MDRNFDTLDLPKRTEAAKGEWAETKPAPLGMSELRIALVVELWAIRQAWRASGNR